MTTTAAAATGSSMAFVADEQCEGTSPGDLRCTDGVWGHESERVTKVTTACSQPAHLDGHSLVYARRRLCNSCGRQNDLPDGGHRQVASASTCIS